MAEPSRQSTAPPRNALIHLCQWLWPGLRYFWLTIVIGSVGLALLNAWLTSKGFSINPTLLEWIHDHWPLVLAGSVLFLILTVVVWYFGRPAPDTSDATLTSKRTDMLDLVEKIWIKDFLEDPHFYSYNEELLSLSLHKSGGSRLDLMLSDPLSHTQPIPSGTTIMQVFDQAGGELLILGEPGAGKTTLLLELGRDLLKRAKDDPEAPIPVIFNLSSWALRKLPLEQWIVRELRMKYDISSQIGKEWVKANQLLLLLDGLDEVAPSALPACIDAINEYYHQKHRSLVVCSRTKEFLHQPGRLALHTAVIVQPLSSEQVDTYLDGFAAKGEDIEGLQQALHQHAALNALVTTPLFLTMLLLAYHGKPVQELLVLLKAPSTDQQHLLFHNYIQRTLQRKGTRLHASAKQTKHWLAWLARQMTAHQQSELYLEQFQPDWLPNRQRVFYRLSFGLFNGLLAGLLVGLLLGLFVGQRGGGLGLGLFVGLLYGSVAGLGFGLSTMISRQGDIEDMKIELAIVLHWSWKRLFNGLVLGLILGLVLGLGVGLFYELLSGLRVGLGFGLLMLGLGLLIGLGYGFGVFSEPGQGELAERARFPINVGLRRSIINGLAGGVVCGQLGGLLVERIIGLPFGISGPLVGLFFGWCSGWGSTVQHYTLRYWLWQGRCTPPPWRYIAFLDDAVEQQLLRKVGEGYIFRHRLLQNYFGSLESTSSPQ